MPLKKCIIFHNGIVILIILPPQRKKKWVCIDGMIEAPVILKKYFVFKIIFIYVSVLPSVFLLAMLAICMKLFLNSVLLKSVRSILLLIVNYMFNVKVT